MSAPFDEFDGIAAVVLHEPDLDAGGIGNLEPPAGVVGLDGQLAVAAVHEHRQSDVGGSAEVGDGLEGGADAAAGVDDVVHQERGHAVHVEVQVGGADKGPGADFGEVIAVEGDVQHAAVDGDAAAPQLGAQAVGEGFAPGQDAD